MLMFAGLRAPERHPTLCPGCWGGTVHYCRGIWGGFGVLSICGAPSAVGQDDVLFSQGVRLEMPCENPMEINAFTTGAVCPESQCILIKSGDISHPLRSLQFCKN